MPTHISTSRHTHTYTDTSNNTHREQDYQKVTHTKKPQQYTLEQIYDINICVIVSKKELGEKRNVTY